MRWLSHVWKSVCGLLAAVLILWKTATVMWVGLALALVLIGGHHALARTKPDRTTA